MPFNAQKFRDIIQSPGKTNRFQFSFSNMPRYMENRFSAEIVSGIVKIWNDLEFFIDASEWPSVSLESIETKYSGANTTIPINPAYTPINIEVIDRENHDIRGYFNEWVNRGFSANNKFGIEYYDDIISDYAVLRVYGDNGAIIKQVKFIEVYPISIGPTQFSWENNNQIARFQVELQYRYYEMSKDVQI